jgi:flagellar hook-length control protein FliK
MADAAQARAPSVNAQVRDNRNSAADGASDASDSGVKAEARNDAHESGAADASSVASATASAMADASASDLVANAPLPLSQNSTGSKATATGASGNVRGASTSAKPGAGARSAAKDTAAAAMSDPVALAMLLAASGMPMSGVSGANGASGSVSGTPADPTSGRQPAGPVTAAAMQPNQLARDTPPMAPDAAKTLIMTDAAPADTSATPPGRSANPDPQPGPPSIMTGSAGVPELVRSFSFNDGSAQTPMVQATISVPVASGSWPHALAAQVHWFVSNDVQSATLRLSPEHLGPVEVHIDVQQSQVNVNFSAAHAETRAALEQSVPRLREIFASGGLTLGQTNVQSDPRPGSQSSPVPARATFTHAQTVEPVAIAAPQSLGLVDEYV